MGKGRWRKSLEIYANAWPQIFEMSEQDSNWDGDSRMTSKSENAALNGKSNIIQPREHADSGGAMRRFCIGDVLGGVIWKAGVGELSVIYLSCFK